MFRDRARNATVAVAVTTVAIAPIAYLAVMTGFSTYDDEGYFLSSLRGYESGHALFNQIYSQYGPFYWQFVAGLFQATGTTIDHDSGRIFTLLLWIGASSFAAAAAWRLTRSVLISCGVAALVLHTQYVYQGEPISPGHVSGLFLGALCFALTLPRRWALTSAGALIGCLFLIKINIGSFALLGVVLVLSVPITQRKVERTWGALVTGGACLAPLLLMSSHLSDTRFLVFALHVSFAVCALAIAVRGFPPSVVGSFAPQARLLGAFGLFVLADVLLTAATSTSLRAIFHSILLDALKQPGFFAFAPEISHNTLLLDLASVAAAVLLYANRRSFSQWSMQRSSVLVLGSAKLAGGALTWLTVSSVNTPLAVSLAPVWLAVVPSRSDRPGVRWSLAAITSVAVFETLQAYPVAGSQRGWASMTLIVVAGALIADGAREIAAGLRGIASIRFVQVIAAAALGEALLTALVLPLPGYITKFRADQPLGLPGAHLVRSDRTTVEGLRDVTAALRAHCQTFISMPGLGSFYLFAGEQPPTYLISSDWMPGISAATQALATAEVENTPGVCALRNDRLVSFWMGPRPLPNTPLVQYVQSHSANTISLPDGYALAPPE
jgi:hypothetical protein